jgi:hypothetical protein
MLFLFADNQRQSQGGAIDLKALIRREGAKGTAIGEADIDLLKKMEPLRGQVEWSTWGSKLESIFSPVFSSVPNLMVRSRFQSFCCLYLTSCPQSSQWTTSTDTSLEVFLPGGLSKSALQKCRDSLSYVVVERPLHGRLSEYTTLSDFVTYTPNEGFSGTDFFTYRMQLGAISTAPATAAIVVEDGDDDYGDEGGQREGPEGEADGEMEEEDIEQGGGGRPSTGKRSKSKRSGGKGRQNFEIEGDGEEQRRRPGRTNGSRRSGGENGGETGGRNKRPVSGAHTPFLQGLMKKMSLNGRDSPKPHQQQKDETSEADEEEEAGSE